MASIFYGDYYDLVFGKPSNSIINFWKQQCQGSTLELGCGTGNITIPLAKENVLITGLDLSSQMIEIAKEKGAKEKVKVEWLVEDMREFDLRKKYSLIFIPSNNLAHLSTIKDLDRCFRNVRRQLADGGKFIIDIFNPSLEILSRKPEQRSLFAEFFDPKSEQRVKVEESNFYDARTQINTVTYHYNDLVTQKEVTETISLRMFFPKELEALLKYNGFKVEHRYGDYNPTPLDKLLFVRFDSHLNKGNRNLR